MIDFTKLELPAEVGQRLVNDSDLDFIGTFNRATGEVLENGKVVAQYGAPLDPFSELEDPRRSLGFHVHPSGRTFLQGSWHKFATNGQNWSDFTYTHFIEAVEHVCSKYSIEPQSAVIRRTEAGVNIIPPISTRQCLDHFIYHKGGSAFSKYSSRQKAGLELKRGRYRIKCYDKAIQYNRPNNLLRFEVNYSGYILAELGVRTLADLMKPEAWQVVQDRTVELFNEIFITEPSIDRSKLTDKQIAFICQAKDPTYWKGMDRSQRSKARKRYTQYVDQYGEHDLKEDLGNSIRSKFNALLDPPQKGRHFTAQLYPVEPPKKGDTLRHKNSDMKKEKRRHFTTSSILVNHYPLPPTKDPFRMEEKNTPKMEVEKTGSTSALESNMERQCLTCKEDISHQRKGSKYCSEKENGKDGKKCRNAGSNPRNNGIRTLQSLEAEPLLFDHTPFLKQMP